MLYLLIHLVISKKERESQRGKNADRKRMDTYSRYRNTDRHTERWTDRQINRKAEKKGWQINRQRLPIVS